MKNDHYETLGVAKGASHEEVRRAYRKKAASSHPDAGGDAETFRTLCLAHEVLSDKARRANYDATGEDGGGPTLEHMATVEAVAAVTRAMDSSQEPWTVDVIGLAVAETRGKLAQVGEALRSGEAEEKRVKKLENRFFVKGTPGKKKSRDPLMEGVIRHRLEQVAETQRKNDRTKELLSMVLEVLKSREFRKDVAAPKDVFSGPGQVTMDQMMRMFRRL